MQIDQEDPKVVSDAEGDETIRTQDDIDNVDLDDNLEVEAVELPEDVDKPELLDSIDGSDDELEEYESDSASSGIEEIGNGISDSVTNPGYGQIEV